MRTIVTCLLCLFIIASCSYLPEDVPSQTPSDSNGQIYWSEDEDFIYIASALTQLDTKSVLLFYPGGLVDPHAYIDILAPVAAFNQRIIIAKVDANLAVLESNKFADIAEETKANDPEINVIISGHSLGGAMACTMVANNLDLVDGIILMASYPAASADLSEWNGRVLSITASNDIVLDRDKFNENKIYLPSGIELASLSDFPSMIDEATTLFYDISGGNHGGFGLYGDQSGDGERTITYEEQKAEVFELILSQYTRSGW